MSCIKLLAGLHLQDFGNTGASLSVITETMPQIYTILVISATKQSYSRFTPSELLCQKY